MCADTRANANAGHDPATAEDLVFADPVNFVGEGVSLPQITHPSQALSQVKSDGYRGGAGEAFTPQGQPEPETVLGVAKLASAGDATKLRDYMHGQDLQQPCYRNCSFSPRPLTIPGVASARAVAQVPLAAAGPPPGVTLPRGTKVPKRLLLGQGQPTNYLLEFTVGPYLYFGRTQGTKADQLPQRFIAGAQAAYAKAKAAGS